ncbi:hypothetical protein GWC95_14555 [Sediminibacterium roseum]|uniref:Uncharacterized protein n=1 Tax=Sediminibacterium roseum TaxID=1978412 RepID=A0ABW9ZX93_9BACT|nr:hypothetical protein [Sediminibacterium roseum]NCI51150.1 hypothetical protein [Sediminibacterium roseum]
MKKLIFTVYVAALVALVPAVIAGYLNRSKKAGDVKTEETLARESDNRHDDGSILHLVRTF